MDGCGYRPTRISVSARASPGLTATDALGCRRVIASSPQEVVEAGIADSVAALQRLQAPAHVAAVAAAAELIAAALRAGGKLLVFGNGGSAADAAHIAAELVGRYLLERAPLPAVALTDSAPALTAIANDYGFAEVFARQVAALGAPGDVALGISTSGSSPNVLGGLAAARERGLRTIGLTGASGGEMPGAVELLIAVPSDSTPRIQEAHALVGHLVCELVERELAGREP
jgi:D-sedoheptulose 7-phosphate isomerase